MSVTASRTVAVTFSGDVTGTQNYAAASNTTSPGQIQVLTLASGFNTITPPSVSGVTNKAVTIIPPAGNTVLMTLKGVTGDTGVPLHKTDPTSVGVDTTLGTFGITAASTVVGVRLAWN